MLPVLCCVHPGESHRTLHGIERGNLRRLLPVWSLPGQYEQILADYDVIIFSDVEAKNFQLAPSFFDRPTPNKVDMGEASKIERGFSEKPHRK